MANGDNNPRVFAETISLDAWRTKFDGQTGVADLHIDVVFQERGRIGGEGSPVRFKLSLKRAEIHVKRDSENIIEIDKTSIRRATSPKPIKRKKQKSKDMKVGGSVEGGLSAISLDTSVKGKAEAGLAITETIEQTDEIFAMEVIHWKTDGGYSFKISSQLAAPLNGQPWQAQDAVMRIRDSNYRRAHGEAPEIRIEIHCRRDDFIIEDIQFSDKNLGFFEKLTRNKQVVVEQYIKDELARAGFPCGDLSEPFTRLILADVVPSVHHDQS
jgi:hypothetical protein